MKTLFENLLNIDNIETDANITEYLSAQEFQKLYKRKLKSVNIEKDNPVCITGNKNSMINLCKEFNAKNIDLSGVYPEHKIDGMRNFALNCKNLIDFKGPDAHENYSDIESLEWFFTWNRKLKTFDLKGIAESTKKIRNIDYMFNKCESIESIDLSYFDFSNLARANFTFNDCPNLKQIDMGNSTTTINAGAMCWNNDNLKEFNAPNMILMGDVVFNNCPSLKNINVRHIDISTIDHNPFNNCTKLENVNMYGLIGKYDYIDFSWAVSLNDKSWDFLFKNLGDGNNAEILLPDTPKKEKLIEKYASIAKQHDFKLV